MKDHPIVRRAEACPPRVKASNYPEPFAARVRDRIKQPLGDLFGLTNFGVNRTTLKPGAESALLHRHKTQDEFIYILAGHPTLITDRGETELDPGMCAGFPAGGVAHHLVNRTTSDVVYLEIGDRSAGDEGTYPNDDLKAVQDKQGKWVFQHKDGTLY
ncbi:MAG: cupin domain-containing protein [Pseudomonadota bacterium]